MAILSSSNSGRAVNVSSPRIRALALALVAVLLACAPTSTAAPPEPEEPQAVTAKEKSFHQELEELATLYFRLRSLAIGTTDAEFKSLGDEISAARLRLQDWDWQKVSGKATRGNSLELTKILTQYHDVAGRLLPYSKELGALQKTDRDKLKARAEELRPKIQPILDEIEQLETRFVEVGLTICRESGTKPFIPQAGVLGLEAPRLEAEQWFHLPKGKTSLDVADFRGKVLVMLFFQAWCPGCHETGFPLIQKLKAKFEKNPDVEFVLVQTVFEGYESNTPERGLETLEKFQLKLPMAQDGVEETRSKIMGAYMTGGTPWVVIVDREGIVRYNDFRISPERATELVEKLLN